MVPGRPPLLLPLNEQTFERVAASLPAWAHPAAEAGFSSVTSLPMPEPRQEEWRYVEIGVALDALILPVGAGEPLPREGSLAAVLGEPTGHAVNVDGHSVSLRAPDGVRLASLSDALAAPGEGLRRALPAG